VGARTRLNVAALNGCVIIAALIGIVLQSWFAFWIVAALLVAGEFYAGSIRPSGRSGQSRR
jgi:1,4-dihydroxy-2-naphthoate octaprenyltransferase